MPDLIDSHCHIDAAAFDADRAAVIARAEAAGVRLLVAPATDQAGWTRLKQIAMHFPQVVPCYGLHPMYLAEHRPDHLEQLRDWIMRERPCAIGECGLDHFHGDLAPQRQRDYFIAQLHLAREFDLPLILHARRALDEMLALLRRIGGLRGVLHSFSGSEQQAEQLCRMGFLLGFGGPLTYPRAQRLHRIAARLPLHALLLETDAPDQPDSAIRGQRNEPARLASVLECLAGLRPESCETIARQTTCNALRLFGLKLPPG